MRQVDARLDAIVGLARLAQGIVELCRRAAQAFLFLRVGECSHLVGSTVAVIARWSEIAIDDALLEARFERVVRLQGKILQHIFLAQGGDVLRLETRLVLHQGAQLAQDGGNLLLVQAGGRWRRHGRC